MSVPATKDVPVSKRLPELVAELTNATKSHDEACRKEQIARSETSSCLNQLNRLQKEFDACVKVMKENAPYHTDWKVR